MLGSGGMARTHMQAFTRVRTIKKLQVFSPTKENREAFGREMAAKYNIEVQVCDRPEDIYKGAHIVAALTEFGGGGDRRQPAGEGRAHRRGRRHRQARRREPRARRRLSALRRYAGAGRPSGTCHRRRAHRLRGAARLQGKHGDGRRSPPQARQLAARQARDACRSGAGQGARAAPRPTRSPIRSAATCRARSSMRSPARSTKRPSAPASAAKSRPNGSCRTSGTEYDAAVDAPATTRESQAVARRANLALIP